MHREQSAPPTKLQRAIDWAMQHPDAGTSATAAAVGVSTSTASKAVAERKRQGRQPGTSDAAQGRADNAADSFNPTVARLVELKRISGECGGINRTHELLNLLSKLTA